MVTVAMVTEAKDEKLQIISSLKPYDKVLHPNIIYQRHNSIWYIEGETNKYF